MKRIAYVLYPLLIGALLLFLFYTTVNHETEVKAGIIRSANLSTDHPLAVRLALGRSTAITFPSRPEKVVPGSPQAVEINFVGRDLTLRPLGNKPGNLIVYSKSSRYVILLQIAPESSYDDAILVNTVSALGRPIRLAEDTFTVEEIRTRNLVDHKDSWISAVIRNGGRVLESDSLPDEIHCKGCVSHVKRPDSELICQYPIKNLECRVRGMGLSIERKVSGN